jgi:hypothetical protein
MRALLPAVFLLFTVATGCKREVETYSSEPLSDYQPIAVGKYITYRLDSTVFTGLGRNEEVHSYQEKQEVAEQLTDNLGQTSYRVERSIRDTAGTEAWRAAGNYLITPLEKKIEVVENGLRTVRLVLPLKRDFSWKGNQYMPFAPYGNRYDFRSDTNFDPSNWDYYYDTVGETLLLNGQTFADVVTVKHIDEETTSSDDVVLNGKTYSEDKYAKGIGLVYQELVMWERELNAGGSSPFKIGFGVKRTVLEHN